MKRWHLSGYVLLAVVAALLFSVAVGAQDTGEVANASLDAEIYEDALKAYAELLKNDTYRNCTLAGISELRQASANKSYELGQAYEEVKQYKSASDAYIEVLKINPSYKDTQTRLANVSNPFAAVRHLTHQGSWKSHKDAAENLTKIVKENPSIDVPEDLEYLLGEEICFWRLPWWIWPMVKLILILLIAVWVILQIRNLRKPRLDIEDFDKGATDLDIGKGVAAMVEASFKQIGESGAHGSRPSLIAGPIEKLEIPADVKSVHPYVKILSALFEWVFRPNVYILSGYLQKPGGDLGAGLTLSLVRKKTGEIIANETIWQKNFDPAITPPEEKDPAPYYRLAEPAAIWTLFQDEAVRDKLSRLQRIKRCIKVLFTFDSSKKKFALLGTSDWRSFAYFRAGVRWALEEQDKNARKLYLEALNQDTDNRGAWFNLGALDVEAGEYNRASKRLKMAREKYLFCWDKISKSESDKKRLRRFLVDDLGIRWAESAEIYKSDGDQIVRIFRDKDSAEIKLDKSKEKAILKISDGRTPELKVEMENDEPNIYAHFLKEPVWYKATYQLAVTYHHWNMQNKDENKPKDCQELAAKEAEKLYKAIEEAIKAPQKNENKGLRDFLESFEPLAVIMCAGILASTEDEKKKDKAERRINSIDSSKLTYRSHYNLACYYTAAAGEKKKDDERNTAYEDALDHLKYALERGGGIVKWAQKDPSLEKLRKDKKGDFDKRIEECSAPVTPSADLLPLAGLRLIGATYAKQLKELGIVSHDDLILKAKDCHAREELAKKLCIDPKFLHRWALLADMMRIVGIDTQYANLLEAAGVRSLDDLKERDPQDLTKLLHQVNSAQSLVKELPQEETVQQWVRDAQKTTKSIVSD